MLLCLSSLAKNRISVSAFLCLAFVWIASGHARAQTAAWTDQALPVRDAIALWLDASTIQAARQANQLPPLEDGASLEVWHDGSAHANHLVQASAEAQPKWARVGDSSTVRMLGEPSCLRKEQANQRLSNATIFIVAAPHRNTGNFLGLLSANAKNQRDYESGFNIDLGPAPSPRFDVLNVEGRGFGGAQDLMDGSLPFEQLRFIEVAIDAQTSRVQCFVDEKLTGSRPWQPNPLSVDEWTLGARFYTHGPGAHQARDHIPCDFAEVIVYDRVLQADEVQSVRAYLKRKHQALAAMLPEQLQTLRIGNPLVKVENPPPIQMLQGGFRVRELPVQLPNINNVRYRHDGRLVALGYNGDIHLLSDTDGDGLEDQAEFFWKNRGSVRGPIGLQLTPKGYVHGQGVIMPSKGKVSLIVDRDGDDRADDEVVIAQGWQEITQNVDAVGIAMDGDGSIYFGLGTADYANAYQTDATGNSAYDIHSERGTVQRILPDLKTRETVCTGIRFPIAFAFNDRGDLFCTEQEGATWLPNGNPFDELLHIQPKRHYGFPPRHPRYNPGVIDEPSTFDYGPQHQSTCGMIFNTPSSQGKIFGPELWQDNALVCGESRGKLWRTQLVQSQHGYVAASQLIACLQMLTVDACVAPDGALVVACHSGPPDWGTGPSGIGKLFRVEMTEPELPRPVAVWAESPNEWRMTFDRPINPVLLRQLQSGTRIECGDFVRAGDRFENLAPPYAVVQRQLIAPRHALTLSSVSLAQDQHTLILNASRFNDRRHVAISMPFGEKSQNAKEQDGSLSALDVDGTANGVRVSWSAAQGKSSPAWSGWLPHLDLSVSKELSRGSLVHDAFWKNFEKNGTIEIETKLDLKSILRPAVQPGSTIDYEWPPESATVRVRASQPIQAYLGSESLSCRAIDDGNNKNKMFEVEFTRSADEDRLVDFRMSMDIQGDRKPLLTISVHTNEDATERPLPLRRFWMPWVIEANTKTDGSSSERIAELKNGNWGRGKLVFQGAKAACSKCHAIDGIGPKIGPDLKNLVHRDYASVRRDILEPSYALNPDYIPHAVVTKDEEILLGVLREENGQLILADKDGKSTMIERDAIAEMKPMRMSIMPEGLHSLLSPEEFDDLMTYLLTPPPHMPEEGPLKAPPIRTQAELARVMQGTDLEWSPERQLHLVLVAGVKDHGPGEHDYPAWQQQWVQLLSAAPKVTIDKAWDFPSDEQLEKADVLIFFQKGTWNDDRQTKIDRYQARGGGAVLIHWAVNGEERVSDMSKRFGLASRGGMINYRHGPLTLDMHNTQHPIMRNMERLSLYDESYWLLTGEEQEVMLLATSQEDGHATPQVWTYEKGQGRVFVSIPGHYSWTFDDPIFRVLLLRGIAWTAKEPVDRFHELVTPGARLAK